VKEHFETSTRVGGLVLFPSVKKTAQLDLIVAPGTSRRHQIKDDGTGREALHPAEVFYGALA
jgi:hypothetical protein